MMRRQTTVPLKLIQTLVHTSTRCQLSAVGSVPLNVMKKLVLQLAKLPTSHADARRAQWKERRNIWIGVKEPSKESILSLPFSKNLKRANENTCLRCGKTFASRSSLKKQHFAHSSMRPFKCTQFDKSCESQKDLNQHFLIHSKPKVPSFACRLCEKRFNSQALLTVHLRHHGGEKPGCTATRGS